MGEPSSQNVKNLSTEFIGWEKRTRGSEPSQYPEEQKANAIPPVAASERGTVQTPGMSSPWALYQGGCRAGRSVVTETPGSEKPIS